MFTREKIPIAMIAQSLDLLLYDADLFLGNLRLSSEMCGNLRKMFGNVRLAFGQLLKNLRKSSKSVRKSLKNRQKRRH